MHAADFDNNQNTKPFKHKNTPLSRKFSPVAKFQAQPIYFLNGSLRTLSPLVVGNKG